MRWQASDDYAVASFSESRYPASVQSMVGDARCMEMLAQMPAPNALLLLSNQRRMM